MKKLSALIATAAMAVAVCLTANTASALDAGKLQIEGEAFVRAWSMQNYTDGDDDNDSDKLDFFDEKLRVQMAYPASEHIKAVTRFDFAETQWGSENMQAYRPAAGTDDQFQVDRAYIQLDKDMFQLRAGLQYIWVGHDIAFKDNMPALRFRVNTPVKFTLGYVKRDESGMLTDEEIDGVDYGDVDRYLLELQYDTDNFEIKGFIVMQTDDSTDEDEPNVFGVAASYDFGRVKLATELDLFGGERGDIDYTGTQWWANVNFKVNDRFSLMSDLVYSTGENDADKEKITVMGDPFGTHKFTEGGWAGATGLKLWDGDLGPLGNGDIYDPRDGNAGAAGLGISAKYSAMENLDLYGQILYLASVEDVDTAYDTATVANLGIRYKILPEVSLILAFNGTNLTAQEGDDPDSAYCLHSAIYYYF